MNYKYDAIIFDFDGVLVDSVEVKTNAFVALYSAHGDEVVKKVMSYHLQNGGISRYEKFQYFHNEILGIHLSDENKVTLGKQFQEMVLDAVIEAPWCNGAYEFLEKFHTKLPLFVASGTPEHELKKIVERRKMAGYFVSTHGTPNTKGTNIKKILLESQIDQHRALMVGDSITDYEGAVEAGVDFIGFSATQKNVFPFDVSVISNLMELQTIER